MMKCPFCQYDNEDGALFCEQCKSDLGGPPPMALAQALEALPLEAFPVEAFPVGNVPMAGLAEPVAEPVPPFAEALPVETLPMEAHPVDSSQTEEIPLAEAPPVSEVPTSDHLPPFVRAEPMALEAEAAPPAPSPVVPPPAPPAVQTPPVEPPAVPPPAAPAFPAAEAGERLPEGAQPKLVVLRGQKINVEYPLYEGTNFIGRADEKPVDIDLEDQEPPDRIWSSRQHAFINYEDGQLVIEDLNSSNGTFVNRTRLYPGQKRQLKVNDVVQIGTVQMKVKI